MFCLFTFLVVVVVVVYVYLLDQNVPNQETEEFDWKLVSRRKHKHLQEAEVNKQQNPVCHSVNNILLLLLLLLFTSR